MRVQDTVTFPLSSAALQKRVTAGLCHYSYTRGNLLFIQVANDSAPMLCSIAQGKMHPSCLVLLCNTGSQDALCHCKYTFEDLLFTQVCSEECVLPKSVLQSIGAESLHTCMSSKCSKVYLQ